MADRPTISQPIANGFQPQSQVAIPQQQPAPASQVDPSISGLAIAALVLGIVAIATSLVPIVNNLSFFIGLLGLIFGIVAILGINKGRKKGRGLAIAGIVLNAVAIVAVLASQAFYGSVLDSVSGSSEASAPSVSQSSATATAAAESSSSQDDYVVTIDQASPSRDYQGDQALVVTYTFTNNSDEETSFMVAISARAYQNNVELDAAVVPSIDSSALMNQVKPGGTITVQEAYSLSDSSPVTVEATKTFSFDNTSIAEKTFDLQ